jgi:hypothetical protein
MAEIKELSDIYKTGVICDTQVIHDANNVFMPYVLNLFARHKAELLEATIDK